MSNVKQYNSSDTKTIVRIAETPSSLSSAATEKYLKNVTRESKLLLEKLSTLPNINDYRKLIK